MFPVLAFIIVVGVIITVALLTAAAERRRTESLYALAKFLQFQFLPYGTPGFHERFERFAPFDEGESRRVKNLMAGERGGTAWYCFDYEYVIVTRNSKGGTSRSTYHFGVVVARLPFTFSYIALGPESMFHRIGEAFGLGDIKFESDEFNRTFNVRGDDKKLIYDLIHPQMMEYLLSLPIYDWQFGPMVAMIVTQGKPEPQDIVDRINALQGCLDRIPEYVRQDFGFTPKWTGPLD